MKTISLTVLMLVFFTSFVFAADPVEVAPDIYTNLFENEKVRVLKLEVKPGEQIAEHSHPDHFVYAMTDGKLSITKEGQTQEVEATKGQVLWLDAETHSTVNTGEAEFQGLVVELKN